MKTHNRTDAGIHFDSSTDKDLVKKSLEVDMQGVKLTLKFLIPQTILSRLTSTDFDELRVKTKHRFLDIVIGKPAGANLDVSKLCGLLQLEGCAFLYNRFIFAQARAGNDVWQAPSTMTRIGPSPEEDERWHDGSGRLQ
jgi:hypothetical protein